MYNMIMCGCCQHMMHLRMSLKERANDMHGTQSQKEKEKEKKTQAQWHLPQKFFN